MASTRTKVLAAEGLFDVRGTSPGTEITVCVPLEPAEVNSTTEELAAAITIIASGMLVCARRSGIVTIAMRVWLSG